MNRRSFVSALAGFPFLGALFRKKDCAEGHESHDWAWIEHEMAGSARWQVEHCLNCFTSRGKPIRLPNRGLPCIEFTDREIRYREFDVPLKARDSRMT